MSRAKLFYAVAGLSLASLCIRTAISFRGGLWRDEALFLGVVNLPSWSAMVKFLQGHESHPPFFYGLMRAWIGIFGQSDSAAMWLPILLGVIIVPSIYAVGAALFNNRVGLIAALLITLSPPVNEYGSSVRPYSLLPLLVLASAHLLIVALDRGAWRRWVGYALVATVMAYTHNWAWVVIGAEAVAVCVFLVVFPARRGRAVREYLVAAALVLLAFLPWMSTLVSQSRDAGHSPLPAEGVLGWLSLAVYAIVIAVQATLLPAPMYGGGILLATLLLAVAVVAAAYVAAYIAASGRGRSRPERAPPRADTRVSTDRSRTALMILAVVPIAAVSVATILSTRSNLLPARCLMMLSPLLFLLISYYFDRQLARSRGDLRLVAVLTAFAVALVGAYTAGLYDLMKRPRSNAREIAGWVASRARAGDLMIVAPGWLASSFNHYYHLPTEQIAYPDSGHRRVFDFAGLRERIVDPKALVAARGRIAEAAHEGHRVWLVSDDASLSRLTVADVRSSVDHHVASASGKIRVHQIRRSLIDIFGAPLSSGGQVASKPRQEELVAELFSPVAAPMVVK